MQLKDKVLGQATAQVAKSAARFEHNETAKELHPVDKHVITTHEGKGLKGEGCKDMLCCKVAPLSQCQIPT